MFPEGFMSFQSSQLFPKDHLTVRQSVAPERTPLWQAAYRPPKRTVAPSSSTSPKGRFR
jgi:hypothetical protein